MINKLYKYQIQNLWPLARSLYLGMVILTLIGCLVVLLEIPILNGIISALTLVGLIGLPFVLLALVVVYDYQNNQGSRAYLLRSIPVSSSKLLFSRLLYYLSYYLITTFLSILLIGSFVLILNSTTSEIPITDLFNSFKNIIENSALGVLISIIIFAGLSNTISILFSITVGSESKFKKFGIGGPILIYFIQYILMQILNLLGILFIPLSMKMPLEGSELTNFRLEIVGKSMFAELSEFIKGQIDSVQIMGLGFILVTIVMLTLMLSITHRSLKNKLILN